MNQNQTQINNPVDHREDGGEDFHEGTPLLPPAAREEYQGQNHILEINPDDGSRNDQNSSFFAPLRTCFKNVVHQIKITAGNQYTSSLANNSAATSPNQVKCWACWEGQINSRKNPLIRVCRGCKDPELQFIHQECINSYISSLPLPRRARSPRTSITNQQTTIQQFLNESEADPVLYDCTRCRDPYVVIELEISPLSVIWDDLWLRFIAIILGIGFLVMTITLTAIGLNASWGKDIILVEIGGIQISALMVALLLTILGVGAGGSLFAAMWVSSSGRKRLFVKGTPLGESIPDSIV